MYTDEPWSLKKDTKKSVKTKKLVTRRSKKADGEKFFIEDKAVSTARVLQFFENNKVKSFTNKELSEKLGLSEGTVTSITTRLEGLKKIKITEILQRVSAYTVYYQHINGPSPRVNKRRGINGDQKDTAQLVWELFEKDVNCVITKKELISTLKNESERQIDHAIRILLLNQDIKIIDDCEISDLQYQHSLGNKKGLKVEMNPDKNYTTLSNFFKNSRIKINKEKFIKNLPNRCRLFYSTKGIITEYLKEDLEKTFKKLNKQSILRRLFE